MQAVLRGFERLGPSFQADLRRKRRQPEADRRDASRLTAGHISHNLAGPATAVLGNLELARKALSSGDAAGATELVEAALGSARELSGRLSEIQQTFAVDGVAR